MKLQEQTRSSTGSASESYEKITDSMKKKFCLKEFIFSFYHITRLALSITIIVLITQTSLKSIKQSSSYLRIQQNIGLWQKNMIVDMITVSTYNCPQSYEPYTSARWEGTKQGCLCKTSLNQYQYVHVLPGQCTMKLMNVGCTRVNPERSIPFVFWKTEKLVCVKRISGLNFFSNLPLTLQSNQIQTCSKGQNYQIFSLSAQGCPITSISNHTNYPNILPDINFSFIRQTSYPIIDIKMSEYSFCQEYNRANISPNRFQNYDLQIVEISNCVEDGDLRVKEIDQITQKDLFENNRRIMDVITYVLPAYPRPTDKFVYKLGTVEYPAWTKSCRDSTQYNLLKTKQTFEFDEVISKAQSCLALTIVMVLVWGFAYSLICIIKRVIEIRSQYKKGILCYPKYIILRIDPNLLNNKLTLSIFSQFVLFLFLLAVSIGLLIQIGVQYDYVSGVELWMRGSYGCMDNKEYFQKLVSDTYVDTLQGSIRTYLICLLSALVGVAIDIVFLAWRFNRGDLSAQKIENIFKSDDLQQKNSDQKIQIQDQNIINQKQQKIDPEKDIIEDDDLEMDKQYNKNISQNSEQNDDPFRKRQQTEQIDMDQIEQNQRQAEEINKRFKARSSLKKNNTIGVPSRTGNISSIHNPTEQSLVAMQEDDLQFNKISMQNSYRRQRKLPRNNNKKRLQSLHILDDE